MQLAHPGAGLVNSLRFRNVFKFRVHLNLTAGDFRRYDAGLRNRVDDDATIADFLILYVRSNAREGSDDVEPPRLWMKTLTSESLDRCGDELTAVVDEDWTHRIMNPRGAQGSTTPLPLRF